jgi:hypothetical protein
VRWTLIALGLCLTVTLPAAAQVAPADVSSILEQSLQPGAVAAFQLAQHLKTRIPALTARATADAWRDEIDRLRRRLLDDVAFHGWPQQWIDAGPRFTDLGSIRAGPGYRLRKLRYEIVPGLESTAILCEPDRSDGPGPAVLDLSGHEPAERRPSTRSGAASPSPAWESSSSIWSGRASES